MNVIEICCKELSITLVYTCDQKCIVLSCILGKDDETKNCTVKKLYVISEWLITKSLTIFNSTGVGSTPHSALIKLTNLNTFRWSFGTSFMLSMENVYCLIIKTSSLIGCNMMNVIEISCKEAKYIS